jgi:hypothetical protein
MSDATYGLWTAAPEAWVAIADAIYEDTQRWLADQGVTGVNLYRAIRTTNPSYDVPDGPAVVHSYPLSSWSLSEYVAGNFLEYQAQFDGSPGFFLTGQFAAADVFATPYSLGRYDEEEVIVLGGDLNVQLERVDDGDDTLYSAPTGAVPRSEQTALQLLGGSYDAEEIRVLLRESWLTDQQRTDLNDLLSNLA